MQNNDVIDKAPKINTPYLVLNSTVLDLIFILSVFISNFLEKPIILFAKTKNIVDNIIFDHANIVENISVKISNNGS